MGAGPAVYVSLVFFCFMLYLKSAEPGSGKKDGYEMGESKESTRSNWDPGGCLELAWVSHHLWPHDAKDKLKKLCLHHWAAHTLNLGFREANQVFGSCRNWTSIFFSLCQQGELADQWQRMWAPRPVLTATLDLHWVSLNLKQLLYFVSTNHLLIWSQKPALLWLTLNSGAYLLTCF